MTLTPKLLAIATLTALALSPATGSADGAEDIFGVYDHYQAGYDAAYGDDWFFDYYQFDVDTRDPYFAQYSDFDYAGNRFGWEEHGLFDEPVSGGDPP